MRIPLDDDKDMEILIYPLIDCVFLLLIFFLVTTMMKRWEMQIPLSLPSVTSSLSTTRAGDRAVVIAVDERRNIYQVVNRDTYSGRQAYVRIRDLDAFLADLSAKRGTDTEVEIAAHRTVPVNTVINVFDMCQGRGFTRTRVRLGSKPYAY